MCQIDPLAFQNYDNCVLYLKCGDNQKLSTVRPLTTLFYLLKYKYKRRKFA